VFREVRRYLDSNFSMLGGAAELLIRQCLFFVVSITGLEKPFRWENPLFAYSRENPIFYSSPLKKGRLLFFG